LNAIEAKEKFYKDIIIVVHHLPSISDADFIRFLEDIVEELIIKRKCIVISIVSIISIL